MRRTVRNFNKLTIWRGNEKGSDNWDDEMMIQAFKRLITHKATKKLYPRWFLCNNWHPRVCETWHGLWNKTWRFCAGRIIVDNFERSSWPRGILYGPGSSGLSQLSNRWKHLKKLGFAKNPEELYKAIKGNAKKKFRLAMTSNACSYEQ